jgi:hypothetical protein
VSAPFQPGDVVVCVDAKPDARDPEAGHLVERKTYRVAVIGPRDTDGSLSVGFDCIPGSRPNTVYGFSVARFRKIDDEVNDAFREQMRALRTPVPANAGDQ